MLRVGERVAITKGSLKDHTGRLAYDGKVKFSTGEWVGIVLDKPVGKNDGTVQGVRYFQCRPKYGTFQRKENVEREKRKSSSLKKPSRLTPSRGGTGIKKPSPVAGTSGSRGASPSRIAVASKVRSPASKHSPKFVRADDSKESSPRVPSSPGGPGTSRRNRTGGATEANSDSKKVAVMKEQIEALQEELAKTKTLVNNNSEEDNTNAEKMESKMEDTLKVYMENEKILKDKLAQATSNAKQLQTENESLSQRLQEVNKMIEAQCSEKDLSKKLIEARAESAELRKQIKDMQEVKQITIAPPTSVAAVPPPPGDSRLRQARRRSSGQNEENPSLGDSAAAAVAATASLPTLQAPSPNPLTTESQENLSDLNDAKEEMKLLEVKFLTAQETIKELKQQLEEVSGKTTMPLDQETNEIAIEEKRELQSALDRLKEENEENCQKVTILERLREEDKTKLSEKILEMEKTISELHEDLGAATKELDQKKNLLSQLQEGSKSQEDDVASEVRIDEVKLEYEKKIRAQKKESDVLFRNMKKQLLEEKRAAERERDEKKRRLEHVTTNLENINSMYNEEQDKTSKVKEDLKKIRSESKELNEMLELIKLEKEELELNLEDKEEELVDTFQQLQKAVKANSELKSQLTSAKNDLIASMPEGEKEVAKLAEKNQQLTDALVSLRDVTTDQIDHLESRVKKLTEERDEYKKNQQNVEEIENELVEATQQVEELQAELEEYGQMDQTIERLQDKVTSLEEQLEKARSANEGLKKLVEANEEMEESHMEMENELQEEIAEKEAALAAAEKHIKKLSSLQKDNQHTIAQFRELSSELQNENKALRTRVGAISTKSKLQIAKVHNAMSRNLKLQSVLSEARIRTAAYHIANMKANQAEQYAQYVRLYVPDSVEVNEKVFSLLALLERLRFTVTLIGAMLNQYYGLKAPIFNADMANHAYRACIRTVEIGQAISVISHKLQASDELALQGIVNKSGAIRVVEKTLIDFLDLVTHDKLSMDTSLEPLSNAAKELNIYSSKYLQGIEVKRTPGVLLRLARLDSLRIHYNHLLSVAQARLIQDLLEVVKVANDGYKEVGPDDPLPESKVNKIEPSKTLTGADKNSLEDISDFEKVLMTYSALQNTSSSLLKGLFNAKSLPEGLKDDKFPEKIADAMHVSQEIVSKVYLALDKMLNADLDQAQSGTATGKGAEMRKQVAKLLSENIDEFKDAVKKVYHELHTITKTIPQKADGKLKSAFATCFPFIAPESTSVETDTAKNEGKSQDLCKVTWLLQAEAIKKELSEISEHQKELKLSRQLIEENKMTIFHLRKEIQAKVTKNQVLGTQIALLQDRAGNAENLQVRIQDLEGRLKDKEDRLGRMKTDYDALRKESFQLRTNLKEERKRTSRYQPRRVETGRMMAPEEAQAEIQLLRTTIAHLQREYNKYKWKTTTSKLARELPPLPSFAPGDSLVSLDSTSNTSSIARDLKNLSAQLLNYRACPKLVDLSVEGASQRWLSHVNSIRKLGRHARELQRRMGQVSETQKSVQWGSKIQPTPHTRLVGRISFPCSSKLDATNRLHKVILDGSQMAQLCQPLMAW